MRLLKEVSVNSYLGYQCSSRLSGEMGLPFPHQLINEVLLFSSASNEGRWQLTIERIVEVTGRAKQQFIVREYELSPFQRHIPIQVRRLKLHVKSISHLWAYGIRARRYRPAGCDTGRSPERAP